MKDAHTLKLTHSSVLNKHGKPYVSVLFERGTDWADAGLPDGKVIKVKGFDDEEIRELEEYLRVHGQEIIDEAKKISGFMNIF